MLLCCRPDGADLLLHSFPPRRSSYLKMLRRLIGSDIDFKVLPASALQSVRVDPGQVEQVIMNLAADGLQCRSRQDFEINIDRKSTRLNSSHRTISYAVFCLKKKKNHE